MMYLSNLSVTRRAILHSMYTPSLLEVPLSVDDVGQTFFKTASTFLKASTNNYAFHNAGLALLNKWLYTLAIRHDVLGTHQQPRLAHCR